MKLTLILSFKEKLQEHHPNQNTQQSSNNTIDSLPTHNMFRLTFTKKIVAVLLGELDLAALCSPNKLKPKILILVSWKTSQQKLSLTLTFS